MNEPSVSIRDLLASYDREVDEIRKEVLATTSGTERVQALNGLRGVISVHDSVLNAVLCPVLDDLPGGSPVADQLRKGCQTRADLLKKFRKLTNGVAAHNVYSVSGSEIEQILEGLNVSFRHHEDEETTAVGRVLEASAQSTDPDVLAARMALAASRSPTRRGSGRGRRFLPQKVLFYADRLHNWSDRHHGWTR
jgi:hypothetical protein